MTNSLLVAEKFGKEHCNVLKAIDNLILQTTNNQCEVIFDVTSIELPQPNGGVRKSKVYVMNRDGFSLLVMGFTGEKALRFKLDYITAFNRMEELIRNGGFKVPTTFKEALILAVQQQEQIEQANRDILALTPKAKFADKAFDTTGKVDIGQAAKILDLGYGRNILFDKLRCYGIFFSNRNEPKQKYINAGYFELKEIFIQRGSHPGFTTTKVLVTQKGLAFINRIMEAKKIETTELQSCL